MTLHPSRSSMVLDRQLHVVSRMLTNVCMGVSAAGPEAASGSRPARGPEYGNVAARDGWPTVEGDPSSLSEMFQNRCLPWPLWPTSSPLLGPCMLSFTRPALTGMHLA